MHHIRECVLQKGGIMKQINNFGILASITWSSNGWEGQTEEDDLAHSEFQYIKENWQAFESLNFGHRKYPSKNGWYIGYSPMFNRLPSYEGSKDVKVVFFKSHNWHDNQNYIVGMYAFPEIDLEIKRKTKHELFKEYHWGNIQSMTDNIVRFNNFLPISNERLNIDRFLPYTKKLGQQGFNYLHSDNVLRILDKAKEMNPSQRDFQIVSSRIKKILFF
jgi:5-methylcytosine-specific restriction enzyme A